MYRSSKAHRLSSSCRAGWVQSRQPGTSKAGRYPSPTKTGPLLPISPVLMAQVRTAIPLPYSGNTYGQPFSPAGPMAAENRGYAIFTEMPRRGVPGKWASGIQRSRKPVVEVLAKGRSIYVSPILVSEPWL
jgi:hypothetical protein